MKGLRLIVVLGALVLLGGAAIVLGIPWAKGIYLEHRLFPNRISYELQDAPAAPTRAERVQAWLEKNRSWIVAAEKRFHISRIAIGGLIAYEALVDVHLSRYAGLANWSGPGKVHFKQYRFAEGDPLAKQVEDMGMLPKRTMQQREKILQTAQWSSLYIAASMRALANIVRQETRHDISCDPGALVTLDSAWTLHSAKRYFATHHRKHFVFTDNFAGNWVTGQQAFLRRAVGASAVCPVPFHN